MDEEKDFVFIMTPFLLVIFLLVIFIFLFTIQTKIMLAITIGIITSSSVQYYNYKLNLEKLKKKNFQNKISREDSIIKELEKLENELKKEKNEKEKIIKMKIGNKNIDDYIQKNFKKLSPKYDPDELKKIQLIKNNIKSRFQNKKVNKYNDRNKIQIIDDYYEVSFLEEYIDENKLLEVITKLLINISKEDIITEYTDHICEELGNYSENDKLKFSKFLKIKLTKFIFQY